MVAARTVNPFLDRTAGSSPATPTNWCNSGNLPDDYRVSPGEGSMPSASARKAVVGDNKPRGGSLFEEGEASYLVITSKRLVFNRKHFSNLYKNK